MTKDFLHITDFTTDEIWETLSLAQSIKKINPSVRTVFGGFHPSAIPNDCLEEDAVDQVIVGEGEEAFLKILLPYFDTSYYNYSHIFYKYN